METVEFFKEWRRVCLKNTDCDNCPFVHSCHTSLSPDEYTDNEIKAIILDVEQWAREHPVKTRQSEFLKMFPEADVNENGILEVCPALLFASHRGKKGGCSTLNRSCDDCRKKFWSTEVE